MSAESFILYKHSCVHCLRKPQVRRDVGLDLHLWILNLVLFPQHCPPPPFPSPAPRRTALPPLILLADFKKIFIHLFDCARSHLPHSGSSIFSCSMRTHSCSVWDLVPWPGIEPRHWEHEVLATGPSRKPPTKRLFLHSFVPSTSLSRLPSNSFLQRGHEQLQRRSCHQCMHLWERRSNTECP